MLTAWPATRRAGALVSFNGKSFDAPVLETRYLFHRLAWAARGLPHVDVLHPARRFWGASPARAARSARSKRTCSARGAVGDVPGFEIPGALLPVRAHRRRAAARGGARAQPARSAVARRAHRAPAPSRATGHPDVRATRAKRWRSAACTRARGLDARAAARSSMRWRRRRGGTDRSGSKRCARWRSRWRRARRTTRRRRAGARCSTYAAARRRRARGHRGARHPPRAPRARSRGGEDVRAAESGSGDPPGWSRRGPARLARIERKMAW